MNAGFLFSLCAGILIGLKIFVLGFMKRKAKKEKPDLWLDPVTYVVTEKDRELYRNLTEQYGSEILKEGIMVMNHGIPYVYTDGKFIRLKDWNSSKRQFLRDLWYGTEGRQT